MASFFKKIGKAVQKVGKVVGTVAQKAAPFAGLIPGVGPLAGLALGAGGSVLAGHNMASHLKSGAAGAASGLAGSKLLGGKGIGGIAALLKGGGAPAAAGSGATAAAGAGGGGGMLGSIGSLVAEAKKRGISIGDLISGGIGAAGAVSGIVGSAKSGKKESDYLGRQSAIADQLNARGSSLADPAAAALVARLKQGSQPYIDRANPFSAKFAPPPPVAPMPGPAVAPQLPAPSLPAPAPTMPSFMPPALRRRLMPPVAA
jgi:hypothetical protein